MASVSPEVDALLKKLKEEKATLVKKLEPLNNAREGIVNQLQALEAKKVKLDDEIHAIERPRLGELDHQVNALERMIKPPTRSMPAETGKVGAIA